MMVFAVPAENALFDLHLLPHNGFFRAEQDPAAKAKVPFTPWELLRRYIAPVG